MHIRGSKNHTQNVNFLTYGFGGVFVGGLVTCAAVHGRNDYRVKETKILKKSQ